MKLWGGAYGTVVLPYSGPWNGSIQNTLLVRQKLPYNHSQEVDLDVASTNPVGGAYPTPFEMLPDYLHQYAGEIALIVVGALLVVVVAGALVLRRRGRVSVLVFIDEVLAFWIYWIVLLWFSTQSHVQSDFQGAGCATFFSSGLSVLTVYALLTHRFKRQLPVSPVSDERACTLWRTTISRVLILVSIQRLTT
jgi:hypothetical protein